MKRSNHRSRRAPSASPLLIVAAVFVATTTVPTTARADWFGTGDNAFEIEFVFSK